VRRCCGDAKVLEDAGVFAIVLEKIPSKLARNVSASVKIPTIGIGAGPFCDGQVLVVYDMLGLTERVSSRGSSGGMPKLADILRGAFRTYIGDVKGKSFPTMKESY